MGSREDFGGLNVVVFGDLMQLPPVRARPVFEGLTPVIARRVFGGFGCGVNLWRLFQFFELTVNVRQQNDKDYADLLGRMRMGEMTDADEVVLRTRLIDPTGAPADLLFAAQYHLNMMAEDPLIMTLLPRVSDVLTFNNHVIERMGEESFSIDADDTQVQRKRSSKPWQLKRYSIIVTTETATAKDNKEVPTVAAGLRSNLTLCINSRVMLRRTIDRVNGLVNGLTGVLVEVKMMDGEIYQLGIRFDRTPGQIHWVPKTSAMYELSSGEVRCRRQFPVEAAFGVTCHKAQGLTLANVIMSTESMFANAQFYVSASRVTALSGLHLINLDMAKATVDEKAKEEYRRLRALN
ncbi:hypothetical protein L3Y34_005838 [Caenorhabditis briggsae]|uniref:ATP-dependent DNA helicase n=1 Tax=Caenorhabditis briggsae TaxID=6238 RepID=A0AAE9CXM4_CAEBR|nr:hypothetical protein L3Y34_005838 [Caenorhabditis briggsae]